MGASVPPPQLPGEATVWPSCEGPFYHLLTAVPLVKPAVHHGCAPSWGPSAGPCTQSYSLSARLINLGVNPCLSVSPCLVLYAPPSKEAFLFSWGEGDLSARGRQLWPFGAAEAARCPWPQARIAALSP